MMCGTRSGRRPWWQPVLLLALAASILGGCGTSPPVGGVTAVATSVTASATPSKTATLTALPSLAAALPRTSTPTPSATPTRVPRGTATATRTPTLTATATLTATPSRTPGPRPPTITPTLTITPTATITPTPTPTLTPTPMYSPTPMPTVAAGANVMHVLLIGLDSTENLRGQNSDVIIIAALNKDTRQVSLLSVPRDLWVYIPTYGWSRINTAHRIGYSTNYPGSGPGLLAETIRVNLGIPIDNWARIDFRGFSRVVDELGGVDMVVACPVNLTYQAGEGGEEGDQLLQPGVYHMDGPTALRYVRTRRGGSDFDRARRQHQFLKAVWKETKSTDLLLKIPALWSALKGSYQTDLNLGDVLSLVPIAVELKSQRIRSRYIGAEETIDWITSDGWQVLLPMHDRIQKVVESLYSPPGGSEEGAASEGARVQIWNGTGLPQRALIAADLLGWRGVNVVDTGPADQPTYAETRIIVFQDKPTTVALLVRELRVKEQNVVYQPDADQEADIRVILGVDYNPCR
jgi:polyisoprenyl-teichoic acid--peptidoglycan teichoic acid transferase